MHLYLDKLAKQTNLCQKITSFYLGFCWEKFEFLFDAYFFLSFFFQFKCFYLISCEYEAWDSEIVVCSTKILIINVCLFDVVDWSQQRISRIYADNFHLLTWNCKRNEIVFNKIFLKCCKILTLYVRVQQKT